MLVTLDIPMESIEVFQALCAKHHIEIRHLTDYGPAGGNPRFNLVVPDAKALAALAEMYWG